MRCDNLIVQFVVLVLYYYYKSFREETFLKEAFDDVEELLDATTPLLLLGSQFLKSGGT